MNPEIFKAYDIRGKVGTELTKEVAWNVGQAMADWLPNDGAVAVGRDMRPDSEELAQAVIEGLRLQGREVIDIGLVSTDMIYFAVGKFGLAGGAMVTASHNPGEYNGIKLCREEAKPIGIETGLADIRDGVIAGNFSPANKKGSLKTQDVKEDWIKYVLSFVEADKWPAYKVAIDAGNGMLGAIAPVLSKHVPLQITPMFYELDGTFPNHPADARTEEGMADLQAKVREESLDFGIAFDGDGDRVALVDGQGEVLTGTVMTAILAHYYLAKEPGAAILYNATIGDVVPQSVRREGGVAHRVKVGNSYMRVGMRQHNAIFGGEAAGHYFFRDNWFADSGLLAAIIAIQVLVDSDKKLSELANQFRIYPAIPETVLKVHDKKAMIEKIKHNFSDGAQDELDGITVRYKDAWLNVRPSNTEPVLRLNVEAKDEVALNELVARVKQVIQ